MEVKIIKYEKDELEIELDNLTVAELLRNLLWQDDSVELAVWKREHPIKKPHLVLKTKGKDSKKVLLSTIEKAEKLNEGIIKEFKKEFKGK